MVQLQINVNDGDALLLKLRPVVTSAAPDVARSIYCGETFAADGFFVSSELGMRPFC